MTVQDWLGKDNELGIDIWSKKYQRKNETFDEWLDRVSGGAHEVKKLIMEKKFLFAGRILANRGVDDSEEKTTYSNCYVVAPPEDSIESIYETCKKLARTYSYGGGCGIDISKLAPEGARVKNQAKTTSGAVSFMDTFAQVTEQIGQHGRRGALMISMRCDHPDIEKFITVKSDLKKVNYANISVMVTDKFMDAVERDDNWTLSFTREETGETVEKTVSAKKLFNLLCENNWNFAEPGILFWDRIEQYNLLANNPDFKYAGTNPCGEEPLPAGGSCLLGALNLAEFVTEHGRFDYDQFATAVSIAVNALNKVLDEGLVKHPLAEQKESVRDWRQIGLGIMGLADMLIKLGIRYGSAEAIDVCHEIGVTLAKYALIASSCLAARKGAYPKYTEDVMETDFYRLHADDAVHSWVKTHGLRNSQLLTIAPTGTISTMLGVSGGIEPIFANSYTRRTQSLHGEDVTYKVYTPIVKEYMDKYGIPDEEYLPEFFITSADIPVSERIAMQAAWQKHIDASISSTVNLPNSATVEDVAEVYVDAWRKGLKGVTVYRAGCAREAILTGDNKDTPKEKTPETEAVKPSQYTGKTIGLERHLTTGCGSLHVCAYFDENGNLRNTYLSKGSTGGCNNFMIGLSRMISLSARKGVDIHEIVDQLNSCGTCPSYAVRRATKQDVSVGSCCPVAIGKALIDMWEEVNAMNVSSAEVAPVVEEPNGDKCPECNGELKHEMGCVTCTNCGYSKCG